MDWFQLIGATVGGFLVGFGTGFSFKVYWDRSRKKVVNQTGNVAGGDIAGGDIKKR